MAEIRVGGEPITIVGERPREGATPVDGVFAPEDIEVFVAICLPAVKVGGLLTKDGKTQGQAIPIATFARSKAEFMADAAKVLE